MARTYKRDSRGRFSGSGSGGGGGKSRPAPRQVQRGVNRLTRDNAGRITSVGGSGATARGGRIRTAAGNLRATVTSKAGMVSQGRLTGAPLKSTIGKTSKARLNMGLTRPGKPGQREAYNAARTQLRANKPAAPKPAATASRLGSRLNPAKKADRRAKQDFNKAYNRENRIRASLFSGNKTQAQKEAITKELNKASNLTASKLQQRREVRAQFPVQAKDKLLKASKAPMSGAISKNKDVRNTVNRKAAFARRVTRAGALPSNNQGRKGRQTARTRAKALATYQGARRPEISDATVGFLSSARRSPAFKPMASRLATPSKAAQRSGKALANKAAGTARDKFGRRTMNPAKGTKKARTAARALEFYKSPKATAEKVLQNQGKAGKRTRGFRLPRGMR